MRRRFYSVFAATMCVVLGGAVAAWAFFSATATATQVAGSATLAAPVSAHASAPSSTTVSIAVTAGPSAPAATGYVAYPHGTLAASACTINSTTGSCTVTGVTPGTTTSYDVYSTLAGWVSTAAATVSATTPPAKPTSVTLVGGGAGNAYVNAANKNAVEIDVVLPATSTSSDSVHLTVTDGTTTVTAPVKAATAGSGTVKFTGLDLSTLHDGALTLTTWSSDVGGASASLGATAGKDVVSPAPTVTSPANNAYVASTTPTISGTAGTQAADAGHSADASTVTVNVYSGGTATGQPVQTAAAPVSSGNWSLTPTTLASGQYTVTVSQADGAGNTATSSPVTFTAGPLPPVALKIVNPVGGFLSESGYVEMIDINNNPVANPGPGTIVVTVGGGLLGGHDTVHIRPGDTLSEQFGVLLPLGNHVSATATYNGQTLHS